jgi:hypothetical protein
MMPCASVKATLDGASNIGLDHRLPTIARVKKRFIVFVFLIPGFIRGAFGQVIGRVVCAVGLFILTELCSRTIPFQSANADRRLWLCRATSLMLLFDLLDKLFLSYIFYTYGYCISEI